MKYKYVIVSTEGLVMGPKPTEPQRETKTWEREVRTAELRSGSVQVDLPGLLEEGWVPVRETPCGNCCLVLLCQDEGGKP